MFNCVESSQLESLRVIDIFLDQWLLVHDDGLTLDGVITTRFVILAQEREMKV